MKVRKKDAAHPAIYPTGELPDKLMTDHILYMRTDC